jgi:uncharacterized protein (TIGR02145 family)
MKTIIKVLLILLIVVLCSRCEKENLSEVYTGNILVFSQAAHCHGWVLNNGDTEVDEYGFVWSKSEGSDIQNSKVVGYNGTNYFETTIFSLSPGNTYSLKAYAIYSKDTVYSKEREITTRQTGNFTDSRDGRTYKWVEIGNQTWMAENLSYIPYVSPYTSDTGIFVYNYKGLSVDVAKNTEEFTKYGCLYTWEISLHVCPDGWHLPGDDEWQELERSIGMTSRQISNYGEYTNIYESNLLKTTDWIYSYGKHTNATSFSALPGGYHFREYNYYNNLPSYFNGLGINANFWSSTIIEIDDFPYMKLDYYGITRYMTEENYGYSVRCIKD